MLGGQQRIASTRQSVLELVQEQGQTLVKKTGRGRGETDVAAQVTMFQSLPPELAAHYPHLLAADISHHPYWYTMPYYNLPSMRELLLFSQTPADFLRCQLLSIVRFLFEKQYPWKQQAAPSGYVQRIHLERMLQRLQTLVSDAPEFVSVLSTRGIILEGRHIKHPKAVLSEIVDRGPLYSALEPPKLVAIHGQLEFDHLLVDTDDATGSTFILLDPRGIASLGDPAYDIGKLYQSVRSLTDAIEEDLYSLEYHFTQDYIIIDSFTSAVGQRVSTADALTDALHRPLAEYGDSQQDPNFCLRADFCEAVHLVSATPFYFEGQHPFERALICYLKGAIAFDRFIAANT